jgi:tetratricopeptide (TPR) repeat protein
MSRKDLRAAKRAKKKHQKALKRAQQLARRREAHEQEARQRHALLHDPLAGWVPQVEGIQGLAHRLKATFFQAARLTDRPGLPAEVWSPQRVRSLPTEELVRRLGALGIVANEAAFRDMFAQDWSMSAAAERVWLPQLVPEASVHDRDFVRLAACELHGRWLPDTPFHEALVSAFLDSLEAHEAREDERAVERGLVLWRLLRSRLSEHMRQTDDVDELLNLRESFTFWPLEFASSALRVVPRRPELAPPAAQVLDEMVTQFQEERGDWWLSVKGNRARLLAAAGRSEEAEQLLRRLIEEHPDHAVGYAVLAGLLSHPGADTESRQRALGLLEAAAARPV